MQKQSPTYKYMAKTYHSGTGKRALNLMLVRKCRLKKVNYRLEEWNRAQVATRASGVYI